MTSLADILKMNERQRDAALDRSDLQADECNYRIDFIGPWGFDYSVGASSLKEARGTVRAHLRRHPETDEYSIWAQSGGLRRVEQCDVSPPSTDDRALQGLGWPNASEAAA